jgi:hypothetical protein
MLHAYVGGRPGPDSLHDDSPLAFRYQVNDAVKLVVKAHSPQVLVAAHFNSLQLERTLFGQIVDHLQCGLPGSMVKHPQFSLCGFREFDSPASVHARRL